MFAVATILSLKELNFDLINKISIKLMDIKNIT